MIKVAIIDDEIRIRNVIRQILENQYHKDSMVLEAESVNTGIALIKKHKPDIVLLDIRLKDGLAFDILEHFSEIPFKIIFITAYDEYAIEAFRLSAVDYLLKPVHTDDLIQALKKAEELIKADLLLKLNTLADNFHITDPNGKQLILKTADDIFLVKIADIIHAEADQTYCTFITLGGERIMVSRPLGDFEEMLSPFNFMRVHRSHMVNLRQVKRFHKAEGGNLIMSDGSSVPVAFRKREVLLKKLEEI